MYKWLLASKHVSLESQTHSTTVRVGTKIIHHIKYQGNCRKTGHNIGLDMIPHIRLSTS